MGMTEMKTELFDLKGKVAIITGGNGGIGLGMARGLADAGADIAVVGRNEAKSSEAAAELRGRGVRAIRRVEQGDVPGRGGDGDLRAGRARHINAALADLALARAGRCEQDKADGGKAKLHDGFSFDRRMGRWPVFIGSALARCKQSLTSPPMTSARPAAAASSAAST